MTAHVRIEPVRFPPSPEIKRAIKAAKDAGIAIGSVDIRADGVTIHPPSTTHRNAFDDWIKDQA